MILSSKCTIKRSALEGLNPLSGFRGWSHWRGKGGREKERKTRRAGGEREGTPHFCKLIAATVVGI